MHVASLTLRHFRSYERAEAELPPGVTVVQGPVGSGKTNLLEAIHLGCLGRSFRTSREADLIRRGERVARVTLTTAPEQHRIEAGIERGQPKVFRVDGARAERAPDAELRPLVCVFAPDRLELVKGPAGVRRAHLDDLMGGLWPAARAARRFYLRALAQRNSLLAALRNGASARDSLAGWNREVVYARQIAMYLTRELTPLSFPMIARSFGGRDHTTVMHAHKRIANELLTDPAARSVVDALAKHLGTRPSP